MIGHVRKQVYCNRFALFVITAYKGEDGFEGKDDQYRDTLL